MGEEASICFFFFFLRETSKGKNGKNKGTCSLNQITRIKNEKVKRTGLGMRRGMKHL